jgi:purine-binding chemotaxis protein CheW
MRRCSECAGAVCAESLTSITRLTKANMEPTVKPGTGRSNRTSNDRSSPDDEGSKQLVSFRVGDEEFALEIERVQEIIRHQRLTRVPNSPSFVEGVINLRGKVIPVIALRKRFGMDHKPREGDTRIVVLEVREMVVGIIVDSVPEVLRVPVKVIVDPPRIFESQRDYVTGVAKLTDRLLILLDVDRALAGSDGVVGAAAHGS